MCASCRRAGACADHSTESTWAAYAGVGLSVARLPALRGAGVWQVENVLDAADASAHAGEFEPHTLSIEVEDRPGVLNQARPANDVNHQ